MQTKLNLITKIAKGSGRCRINNVAYQDLMERHGFSGLAEHREQHRTYIEKIVEFSRQPPSRKASVNAQVVDYLKQWICEHILVEDKRFKLECHTKFPGKAIV